MRKVCLFLLIIAVVSISSFSFEGEWNFNIDRVILNDHGTRRQLEVYVENHSTNMEYGGYGTVHVKATCGSYSDVRIIEIAPNSYEAAIFSFYFPEGEIIDILVLSPMEDVFDSWSGVPEIVDYE